MATACTDCGLAGWGVVRIPWDDVPRWRREPGPCGELNPAPHLKLADEQTVLACAALLNACDRASWAPAGFGDWAVLAAPTYPGRVRLAPSFRRFQKAGPRGVSPLVIPTLSNHAMAGTVCLILGSHGPNFGVGGSTPMIDELLLNALSLLTTGNCAGVWALMTAWDPEPIPGDDDRCATPAVGVGVALALVPGASSGALRLAPAGFLRCADEYGSVFELADFLEQPGHAPSWFCPVLGGGHLELIAGAGATSAIPLRLAG